MLTREYRDLSLQDLIIMNKYVNKYLVIVDTDGYHFNLDFPADNGEPEDDEEPEIDEEAEDCKEDEETLKAQCEKKKMSKKEKSKK